MQKIRLKSMTSNYYSMPKQNKNYLQIKKLLFIRQPTKKNFKIFENTEINNI